MAKPKTPFTEAAAELAAQLGNRYWADITTDEAREYVDADVVVAWVAHESLGRDDEIIVGDTLSQRLNSAQARTLLCAVAIGHADKVLEIVRDAVFEQVARDLVYAANLITEQYDPTDAEMSHTSYASQVDDPLIGDRRALARQYVAAGRIGREEQFDV